MRVLASEVLESSRKLARINISKATSRRWRTKYDDADLADATRLNEL